jgi:plastocyanin
MQQPPSCRAMMSSVTRRGLCFGALFAACSTLPFVAARARAALPVIDSCAEFAYLDRTAPDADRDFDWDYAFAADPERCITIRAGQSVQFHGDFPSHPLDPDEGDTPNPIANHGANGLVTFPQVGIYGYRCNFHFSMRGAVQVLPALPVASAVPWVGRPIALVTVALLGIVLLVIVRRTIGLQRG